MAEKLTVEIDLESGDITTVFKDIEKQSKKSGKKTGKQYSKAFEKNIDLRGIKGKFVALGATIITALGLKKSIALAVQQEDAINRLAGALKSSNEFTKESVKDFEEFASSLQEVTRFGDEVIINQLALAKAFGATNEQAKDILKASADLSSALGIDLNSATRNVAKTLGGLAGELGETIPELKNLTQAELRAGKGIEILAKKFSGQATQATKTFSGALQQTFNSIGDFIESLGLVITKNPVVVKSIQDIGKAFINLTKEVKKIDTEAFFDNLVNGATIAGLFIADAFVRPLEIIKNLFINLGASLELIFIDTIPLIVGKGLGKLGELIEDAPFVGKYANKLKGIARTTETEFDKTKSIMDTAFQSMFNQDETAAFENQILALQEYYLRQKEVIKNAGDENSDASKDAGKKVAQGFTSVFLGEMELFGFKVKQKLKFTEDEIKNINKVIASSIKNTLVRGISGGIQNIVASIAKGENVFANFGKFLLDTFGNLAIQLGEFFIAQGIATSALLAVNPPAATIGAGVALVALGSILKSFGGGGSSTGGSSGGGGSVDTGSAGGFDPRDFEEEDLNTEPKTEVSVVVNGDVFDSDETGTRIATLLSDAFGKQGIVLADARFA